MHGESLIVLFGVSGAEIVKHCFRKVFAENRFYLLLLQALICLV